MKRTPRFVAAIVFVLLISPLTAHAMNPGTLEGNITALTQQIQELQAKLNDLLQRKGESTSAICVDLRYSVGPDDSDADTEGDVTRLQRFLTNAGYYTGTITGRVGPRTEAAIKAWQCKHLGVCTGDAESTGYGFVGPKSRAKMACTNPSTVGIVRWDPDQAEHGGGVAFTLALNQTARTDEGDTNYFDVVLREIVPDAGRACLQFRYVLNGTVRIEQSQCLVDSQANTVRLDTEGETLNFTVTPEILGKDRASLRVTILSSHPQPPCSGGVGCIPPPSGTFTATPTSGQAPLYVKFSTNEKYGTMYYDTGSFLAKCFAGEGCDLSSGAGWTYTNPGTYTASLKNPAGNVVGETAITVISSHPAPTCSYRSDSAGIPNGIVFTSPQTASNCKALCTINRNEKYGVGDSGVCTFTGQSGVGNSTMKIEGDDTKNFLGISWPDAGTVYAPGTSVRVTWRQQGLDSLQLDVTLETSSPATERHLSTPSAKSGVTYITLPVSDNLGILADGPAVIKIRPMGISDGDPRARLMASVPIVIRSKTTSATPSCRIAFDKSSYKLGETATVRWSSTYATFGAFVSDPTGKDNLSVPGDKLAASGTQSILVNVSGNPSVTLAVYNTDGQRGDCRATISVDTPQITVSQQVCPAGTRGTHPNCAELGTYSFTHNSQVVESHSNVTYAEAVSWCEQHRAGRVGSIQCAWKGSFFLDTVVDPAAGIFQGASAGNAVNLAMLEQLAAALRAIKTQFGW